MDRLPPRAKRRGAVGGGELGREPAGVGGRGILTPSIRRRRASPKRKEGGGGGGYGAAEMGRSGMEGGGEVVGRGLEGGGRGGEDDDGVIPNCLWEHFCE